MLPVEAFARQQIVSGREFPRSRAALKGEILGMVIAVADEHVEDHAPKHLRYLPLVVRECPRDQHQIRVVQARNAVVGVREPRCRDRVRLAAVGVAVEARRREKFPAQQTRFRHFDAAFSREPRTGVFECADVLRIRRSAELHEPFPPVKLREDLRTSAAGGAAAEIKRF